MKRVPSRSSAPVAAGAPVTENTPVKLRRFGPRRDMLALESRIVFDGAAAADVQADFSQARDGAPHAPAHRILAPEQRLPGLAPDQPALEPAATSGTGRSVLIVDSRVPDYQSFVDAAGAGVIVIVIDQNSDGMEQIAAALQNMRGLDSISIVSHGDNGMLLLGDSALVGSDLAKYSAELATLGAALGDNGELLLYGCDVGAGAAGQAFLDSLAGMTGALVAASSNATGAAGLGGDWHLEITTGTVTTAPAFDTGALQDYDYVLHTTSVATLAQLKAAISAGNSDGLDDTITLTANITFASAADTIAINVTDGKTMTIVGAGFTIDGAYQARVMSTASSNVGSAIEIENLTIQRGLVSGNGGNGGASIAGASAQGGAFFNTGTLTLSGVTVTQNAATGGGGGGGLSPGFYGGGGGGGSGASGIGGANGGNSGSGYYVGAAGGGGNGGNGGAYMTMGGKGGSAAGGGAGGTGFGYANGGAGASATAGAVTIGGGGGGSGWDDTGGDGGAAAGAIYNAGTLTIVGTSAISNNIAAGGGGGGGGGAGEHGGLGGRGVGAIWNAAGGFVRITASNFAAMTGNAANSGVIGGVTNSGSNAGFSSPAAVANIYNDSANPGGNVDTNYSPGPVVTDARISISGASGTGGAFKIGDTVTATWNNTAGGDNNAGVTGVTMDFTQFGGGAAVAATDSSGTWTASYTINAGAIDAANRNVSVTATNGDPTTTADTTNATVDNVALTVTDARLSISGATGTGGAFKIGDTVTATWNNTAGGDNNSDTVSGATVDFSQFGGGAAVAATNSAGTWTASYTITAGAVDTTNRNVSLTATDNAGNTTTTADTSNATIDNVAPTVTNANISISGASGTGGAFKIGDTVTATWNNTAGGDNNSDTISGATVDFSQFGGGAAVAATNSAGTWTATYTITAGAVDAANRNVSVTATDNAGNATTTADTTNATVDNVAPTVTNANISISGGSGSGGAYKIGDTVTATWNNTAGGDNNADTISSATVDFSQFGGGAAVAATNSSGTWSATYTITAGALDAANRNVSVTATDNAGNSTTTADTSNATVDNVAPTVTNANISISGATGTGGAFKIGDTVTATWNNTAGGDNNSDTISGASVDFSQFGGGASVAATNSSGTWTATYTITAGAVDAANRNVSITATDNAGNSTTTADTSNATVDNVAPTVTDANISISGGSGSSGAYKIGDTVTATWNNTAGGDNNSDTVSGATVDFSQFGGGAAVAATNSSGTWSATYVITAGALQATGRNVSITATDNAGNARTAADSSNATIDSARPTLGIVVADSALAAGETSLVTFTFSEAVTGFTNADLTIANGTLSAVSSADGGITWTATLTPTASVTDASNLITLDNTGFADTAGNAGSGSTNSNNYAIDTARPTAAIVVADNALAAGETSLVTITFSEAVSGFTNADLTIANGALSAVGSLDGGITWTATFTPTASITDASNLITLDNTGVLDAAGNAGSGSTDSNNYAIDTARPTANIVVADSALAAGETSLVTITFSEAVTGFTNADLTIANGALSAVSSVDGGITWTATFTPTASVTDTSNLITLDNTGVLDAAGNAGSGTTDSNNYAIDTVRPTASIVVADSALAAGETSLVTITFSEAVTGFTNADLSIANGTLSAVSSADGGITWTATFTPTASTSDASNLITLDNTGVLDAAGNAGTGSTDSNNYAIDTARPTASIVVADSALAVGETSLVTITFSEAVTGFTNADLSIANGTLGAVSSADGGITWTATLTPTASITDASNLVTLDNTGVLDAAGNAGTGSTNSNNYAIDTVRPTASVVVADSALAAGETSLVTITFSEAVTGFTNADLSIANGALSAVSSADGGITWTATFTPTASVTDASNLITLDNTGVLDAAGNAGSGSTDSNNYAIDTVRPTASIVVADSALAAGETSLVTITFSEAVTGFTNADLSIANGALGAVSSADGGVTWTATFTPTAGVADASNLITLGNTGVLDAAGNAGTGSTDSNNYAIDTARPTASIVVADSALAAGETSLVTITFSEAVTGFSNADLTIDNGTLSAVSSADGGITWTATFTPTASMIDASNLITLDNTGVLDTAGNTGSGTTVSGNYTIDTTAPTASIVVADSALTVGETSLVTITFSEAVTGFTNADLTIANGTLSAVSSADGGITWTATLTPTASIADASNVITLDNTGIANIAGNAGIGSTDSNNYAIDTGRPTASIVVADSALAAGETSLVTITFSEAVTGFSNADLSTANGTLSAVSSADGGITWTATFTPAASTADASNLITLDNTGVLDAAGNAGTGSTDSNNYAIDTARPTATIVVADNALAAGETSLVTITFSEAVIGFSNADLSIANGTLSAVSSADGGATWTATFTPAASITDASNLITLDNSGVLDAAGNAGTGSTDSNNYAIDTIRPTASIVVADSALAAGETSLVTITFSEAVTGFTNTDLTIANGALSAVSSADGGITWTATFTPAASTTDTSNLITLDNSGVLDAAGNAGTGSTDSNNYAIDTARPTASIVVADSALAVGETSLVTITFSEAVTGFTNADLSIANGALSAVSSADGGITWTATFTPTASTTDASNLITLDNTGLLDAAGNAGSGSTDSNNYAIDTLRPTASIVVADNALIAGETSLVTITFSEAVTGFTNADLTIDNGTLSAVSSADGGITWTALFTPEASITDASNLITLDNTSIADTAGNAGSGSTVSNTYAIDTVRPSAAIVVADTALFVGETSLVTITFSEAVTGFTNADLAVANGALSAVSSADGGITWSATFTPSANVTDATNLVTLANTGVLDAAGNAGSGSTDSNNYAIDTAPPSTPPAPLLAAASDSGSSSSDGITRNTTPLVTGSAADGTTITLFDTDGITVLGSTVATGGVWAITSTPLADGSHSLTVVASKNGMNMSERSGALLIVIDTLAPAAPGMPTAGNGAMVTNDPTPEFTGSGAEPGSLITLRAGSTTIATAQADANGNWHSAPVLIGPGQFQITASATDAAGNASVASAARTLAISGHVPQNLPSMPVPRPLAPSDSGRLEFDNDTVISLAIAGPFSRSPLATTLAEAANGGRMFDLDLPDFQADEIRLMLPATLFEGIELVSLRATLAGGQPLPGWLLFDELNRTLHGQVPVGALPNITIEVIGIDTKGKQHRATFKIDAAGLESAPPARAQSASSQLPPPASGIDLLAALGLAGVKPGTLIDGPAVEGAGETPVHARHLSDQLDRAAQRFTHDSDATLRHLEQIAKQAAASTHA